VIRQLAADVFDRLERGWESEPARKGTASILLFVFVSTLVVVECERRGLLPTLPWDIPSNHFVAVEWTVDLLLLFELIDLVFSLAASVAGSLGKQLEVFALILLRKSFEELRNFPEPIDLKSLPIATTFEPAILPLWNMAADAVGALAIFGALVVYRRLQLHRPITGSGADTDRFVVTKKVVALLLLGVVGVLVGHSVYTALWVQAPTGLYPAIFTAFIFFDIGIVLISMRYSQQFRVVFRNFGFTVVTVFLRLAITANPGERAALGFAVALYAIGVAWLYNRAGDTVPPAEEIA
jgi:hypothetical protein